MIVFSEKPIVQGSDSFTETDSKVTISCSVSLVEGSPPITTVRWLRNEIYLNTSDSNKYSGGTPDNPSLSIYNLASTDGGVYKCTATNLVGTTESTNSVPLGE